MSADESFLRRWSRRKLDQDDEPVPPVPAEAVEETDTAADPDSAAADPPPDLPDIDSLDKDSDFTPFMADGVPEELKRMALRKLWLSDPVFANLDGLNDYDEDFGAIVKAGAEFMEKLKATQDAEGGIEKTVDNFVDGEGESVADGDREQLADAPDTVSEPETAAVENPEPVDSDKKPDDADDPEQV